jgi:putative hydrolase of the HAD superfamily
MTFPGTLWSVSRLQPGRQTRQWDRISRLSTEFSAIILDFDGLIIDSESPLLEIWQEIYREYDCELELEQWQHALGTFGGFDPYADLLARTGRSPDRTELVPALKARHYQCCAALPLLPGVRRLVDDAREAGLKVAVASSSAEEWVGPFLDQHGLRLQLDAVCTRDHVSRVKPAPDLFLLAAERMGTAPGACIVFEDSPNGLRAAHAAGMWTVAVPNGPTRALALPDPHLVLESLDQMPLREILAVLPSRRNSSA